MLPIILSHSNGSLFPCARNRSPSVLVIEPMAFIAESPQFWSLPSQLLSAWAVRPSLFVPCFSLRFGVLFFGGAGPSPGYPLVESNTWLYSIWWFGLVGFSFLVSAVSGLLFVFVSVLLRLRLLLLVIFITTLTTEASLDAHENNSRLAGVGVRQPAVAAVLYSRVFFVFSVFMCMWLFCLCCFCFRFRFWNLHCAGAGFGVSCAQTQRHIRMPQTQGGVLV